MRYTVKSGSNCIVVSDGDPAIDVRPWVTKQANVFAEEDVFVDPTGEVGEIGPKCKGRGASLAKQGNFGFFKDGRLLLVRMDHVEVMR